MSKRMGASTSADLVEYLKKPSSYPEQHGPVRLIETHISWVFLTERHAYKLKKPVRFEFLDFSTSELRHQACQDELRLNRRLAADVYLDVLPVTCDKDGSYSLAGGGETADWLVKMKRLPAEQALDKVICGGRLTPSNAHEVANHLVDFYISLAPRTLVAVDYRRAIEQHIRANGDALAGGPSAPQDGIRRAQSAQLRFLDIESDLLARRVESGRIVEGHGDLRPEHIYLGSPPAVIDCLEFSRELRTIDIADELSFLAMECERLGENQFGDLVLATYQEASGDKIPPRLSVFFRAYRACVRAKVELLRRNQAGEDDSEDLETAYAFRQYIGMADRYAEQLGPPVLLVVGGVMGTGKSTLAKELASRWSIPRLSTDEIRRELFGENNSPRDFGEGNYRPAARQRVYDELFHRTDDILSERQSLIADGTFLTRALRNQAHDLARRHGAASLHILCVCPPQTAVERVRTRSESGRSESEARAEHYEQQAQTLEPPHSGEPAVRVDTTQAMSLQLDLISRDLRQVLAK